MTIIVLLILAGVSLNLIAGSNGIMRKAVSAVDISNVETAKEQVSLKIMEFLQDYYEKKYVDNNVINIESGDWVYKEYESKTISTPDYEFSITLPNGMSAADLEHPYIVTIEKSNRLKSKVTGTLSVNGILKWEDSNINDEDTETEINKKAEKDLKDLLAVSNIEMTLEDILNSPTMAQKITENENIKNYFNPTTVENILESGKSLDEILEIAQINQITMEDILDNENMLTKIFSDNKITEYLQKIENKTTFDKIISNEVAKNVLKETNKTLYYEAARVNLTLVPITSKTGTVDVSQDGEYTLTGEARLESEEILDLNTFTFYVEVKDLASYYDGTSVSLNQTSAGVIMGSGDTGNMTQSIHCGYWFRANHILDVMTGTGGIAQPMIENIPSGYNRLALTYDGQTFKAILNGEVQWEYGSAHCYSTKLQVGGDSKAPWYRNGGYIGFVNGVYRNIKVYDMALDPADL